MGGRVRPGAPALTRPDPRNSFSPSEINTFPLITTPRMAKHRHNSRGSHSGGSSSPSTSDDQFIARVLEFSNWARANQRVVTIFGIVLVAIVASVIYLVENRQTRIAEAGTRLEQIQGSLGIGDPEAAKVGLSQFLEQFGDTPYGGEAALILARLYMDTEQPDLAIRALERVDLSLGEPLGAPATLLEAQAHEMAGNLAAAEEAFLRVAEGAEMQFERTDGRSQAARVRTAMGDYQGAAELYEEILAELEPSHPDRGLYEMRLGEVEALARG